MPNTSFTLSPEQLDALRSVPLLEMPNRLRVALGMAKARQVDLVEATGLDPSMVSNFVNGNYRTMTLDTARKLADFFGCQIDDLFPARAVAS